MTPKTTLHSGWPSVATSTTLAAAPASIPIRLRRTIRLIAFVPLNLFRTQIIPARIPSRPIKLLRRTYGASRKYRRRPHTARWLNGLSAVDAGDRTANRCQWRAVVQVNRLAIALDAQLLPGGRQIHVHRPVLHLG